MDGLPVNASLDDLIDPPCVEDILEASSLVVRLAGKGPEQAYIALAQMIRNRCCVARSHMRACGRVHPNFGNGSWDAACGLQRLNAGMGRVQLSRAQLRAISSLCRVAAGEEEDPTCGATLCHRHDEEPPWASSVVATALIGDLVFYAARSAADFPDQIHARS